MIYIFKFYKWEKGYTYSLDIMHDKAGYYICWGCIVWVPFFYAMTSYYLVSNSGTNSLISVLLFITLCVNFFILPILFFFIQPQ